MSQTTSLNMWSFTGWTSSEEAVVFKKREPWSWGVDFEVFFFPLCCLAKGSNHFSEQTEHHSNTNQRGDDANANEQCLLSRAGGETPVGEDQTLFILQELPESEEIAHITVVEELGSLCYGGPMNAKLQSTRRRFLKLEKARRICIGTVERTQMGAEVFSGKVCKDMDTGYGERRRRFMWPNFTDLCQTRQLLRARDDGRESVKQGLSRSVVFRQQRAGTEEPYTRSVLSPFTFLTTVYWFLLFET